MVSGADLMSGEFTCPACGAPVDASARFQDYIICPFCNTQSYAGDSNKAISQESGPDATATLTEAFSRFSTGQHGYIRWNNDVHEYYITGYIMYEYDGGFWYEWYMDIGGQGYWLQEDEGLYILYVEIPVQDQNVVYMLSQLAAQGSEDLKIGKMLKGVNPDMGTWNLMEYGKATISSHSGSLPSPVQNGKNIVFIDGAGNKIRFSLEIDQTDGTGYMCKGWPLEYEWIKTDDEPEPKGTPGSF